MLRNYLKTAWRNLLKNKFYSVINIAGLTLGLAIGILILLWVQDELSFNAFHKNAKNIYRLDIQGGTGATKQIFEFGVAPIAQLAKQELPEVTNAARLCYDVNFSMYKYQDKVFADESVAYADPSLFSMFDFPLIQGNTAKPFADDNSVVITQTTAKKFFGDADPIGKVIVADDKQNFTVSGVINDMPKNSDIQLDIILPLSYNIKFMLAQGQDLSNNFGLLDYVAFLSVKQGASIKDLEAKILKIHLKHKPDDTDASYLMEPLTKMHLYNADLSDRGIGTVRIFIAIALLILVIACINYVNLSTARSMLRSKEISMRKIVGAAKFHLFLQFIIETAVLFTIAALLAIGVAYTLMPVFNNISGKQMALDLSDFHIWLVILCTIAGTLIASSIYPALLLSSFEPLKALKGKISTGIGDALFRKILVVGQFSFSIILIIGTIVITGQLRYIHNKDLGYNKEHVFSVWMRDASPHYEAVKAELLKQPGIADVTRSNQNIVRFGGFTGSADWDGKDPKQNLIMHEISVDKNFISFFKMNMQAGTSFAGAPNDTAHFILNEAAIKETGIKDPIGKRFSMNGVKGTIIGVVKDFHYASMREKITPAAFYYHPQYFNRMYIRVAGKDPSEAIAAAEKQFKRYNGQYPFGYAFLDETFDSIYKGESRQATLFDYFSGIAIFISCLGLLGLATYTAQVRVREIGVRKVLGASVANIAGMLSMDFLKLVTIAILIATPAAWYLMNKWLQDFAYRINMQWWMFVAAGLLAILIAFATISYQAVKAALMNPVKSLRSE
ncbi:MAG TPA: ABC transporter permease [Mucilaginibacter sp.]|jgi:putative ABC transport system permease protein|nr:ABC transporter permease [Mucilaginibacter sp.]